jgi:hypothetical protein
MFLGPVNSLLEYSVMPLWVALRGSDSPYRTVHSIRGRCFTQLPDTLHIQESDRLYVEEHKFIPL